MNRLLVSLVFFAMLAIPGMAQNTCSQVATTSCIDSSTISTSGGSYVIPLAARGFSAITVEELIAGSPSTMTVLIQGCGKGGTCDTLDTSTSTVSVVRQPNPLKLYDHLTLTATWTGGSSVSMRAITSVYAVAPISQSGITGAVLLSTYPVGNTLYVDGSRTDSYTPTGTIDFPYKTPGAALAAASALVTAGGTGPYAVWINPGTYVDSGALSGPAVELVIFGNGSTWTVASGVTVNGQTVVYDLNTVGAVTYAYTGTNRSERHGGSYSGGNVIINGYVHWYGVNASGNSYTTTVNGTLAGDFVSGSMQIKSGGTSALIALNNTNMTKTSGYNFDMTSGGILALNGGFLATVAGTYNIYAPTSNTVAASHEVQGLTFITGLGASFGSGTYYAYDNLSIDPVGVLGYAFYRQGMTALHPYSASYSATYNTATNCSSSASPAVCAAASSGSVVVAASATTVVVNTTAVTANSQIKLQEDSSLGTKLSVTCNTTPATTAPTVSARVAGTSFTITTTVPTTNPRCFSYSIVN